jgi:hypothetical protein
MSAALPQRDPGIRINSPPEGPRGAPGAASVVGGCGKVGVGRLNALLGALGGRLWGRLSRSRRRRLGSSQCRGPEVEAQGLVSGLVRARLAPVLAARAARINGSPPSSQPWKHRRRDSGDPRIRLNGPGGAAQRAQERLQASGVGVGVEARRALLGPPGQLQRRLLPAAAPAAHAGAHPAQFVNLFDSESRGT